MWHFGETAPLIPIVLVDEKPLIPTRSHFSGYFHSFAGCGKTLINFNEILKKRNRKVRNGHGSFTNHTEPQHMRTCHDFTDCLKSS